MKREKYQQMKEDSKRTKQMKKKGKISPIIGNVLRMLSENYS